MREVEKKTVESYTYLWDKVAKKSDPGDLTHFEAVQSALTNPIVDGLLGIEVGTGPGYDIEFMAKKFPDKKFISIDFNCSIFSVSMRLKKYKNITLIRASALELPFKMEKFDFAYSFGVLHHTADPKAGMREINRVLKKQAPMSLYLYEEHEENRFKFYFLKLITLTRKVTVRLPVNLLYFLCIVFSPVVYFLFSLPAMILRLISFTRPIADKLPFNFGKHPFTLVGDLFDRFSAQIEKRYERDELNLELKDSKFNNIVLTKISDTAGWVVRALK